ncbi:MAG: TIM-barrel domain-containing protein, partial [Candidatus Eremiobacterota bacterium]
MLRRLFLCLLLLVQAGPAVAQEGLVRAEWVGPGVARFVPQGLDPDNLPVSLALVEPLRGRGPLPDDFRVRPRFHGSGSASVAVVEAVDFYATGEVLGPLRRNGTVIELYNHDNGYYRDHGGRRLYQAHPWVIGVRRDGSAFGVLFDSTWRARLSLPAGEVRFESEGPPFPVYVVERPGPAEVVRALADLTGKPPMPPLWSLGYQQCRWSYAPASRVREVASELRARKIPCDVMWMDIDYMDAFKVFTFDRKGFGDPRALNDFLHERGFKATWMIDPGVKREEGYAVYDSGTREDVWVRDAHGEVYVGSVWPGPCVFPDFTRPDVRRWWASLYADWLAVGVDGVWNDMNEPAIFHRPSKTMPDDNRHRGGDGLPEGPHVQYHNVYGMLMARGTRQGMMAARPDRRPFVLTRANYVGGHRYAATWTGDNASTWEHLRASIPMSLNLGLSGQPFNGPDLGGFNGPAEADLWGHWVGAGAFFPFCRGHADKASPPKEPWAFGPEVERAARLALSRRYRLLPYFYTLFEEAHRTGMPVMRPVFFADPTDPELRNVDDAYLVGPSLLVVPRWASGTPLAWREISLVEGDRGDRFQARLLQAPGSVIPLGRVVQHTGEPMLQPLTLSVVLDDRGQARG